IAESSARAAPGGVPGRYGNTPRRQSGSGVGRRRLSTPRSRGSAGRGRIDLRILMSDWRIYQGDGVRRPAALGDRPAAPAWRQFDSMTSTRATTFKPPKGVVEAVNAALYLRRPVLVTGDPGTGKSSLAYAVAKELDLGEVLTWNINSRSTLDQGLYDYD